MLAGQTQPSPGTVRGTDLCALVFVAAGIAAGSTGLGIRQNAAIVCFTLAWTTTAMTRLREFRQGRRPALRLDRIDRSTAAMLLAGAVPWFPLAFLPSLYPTSAFWIPFAVTPQMQALGMLLALGVVAEPFFQSRSQQPLPPAAECRFSMSIFIRSAAILLLTGSTVFTLFSGLWVTMALWRARGFLVCKLDSVIANVEESTGISVQPVAPEGNS
jgi:hypothetical protein